LRLTAFRTKYGKKVIGGRCGNLIRTPSSTEELSAGFVMVSDTLVKQAEQEHLESLNKQIVYWNLPSIQVKSD
jgi:formate dehydrogenase assembly factor FdhD